MNLAVNADQSHTQNDILPGGLGFRDLTVIMVTTVIGAGIFGLMGSTIAQTGYSAWLAWIAAMVFGLLLCAPQLVVGSMTRLMGGEYSILSTTMGKTITGIYSLCYLSSPLGLGTLGIALGSYLAAIFPGVDSRILAFIAITALFITNIFGVKFMAKVQNLLTVFLFLGMAIYVVIGLGHISQPVFSFSDPEFFSGGLNGFISAVVIASMGTQGIKLSINYSREARDPTKDVAPVSLVSAVIVAVVYALLAIVTVGTVPLSVSAGGVMTSSAQAFLQGPLYLLFAIGAPIFAIATSLSSNFASMRVPVERACELNFLPDFLAKKNKYGVSYIILIIMYIACLLPAVFQVPIDTWLGYTTLINSTVPLLVTTACIMLPAKRKDLWEKRRLRIPVGVYYLLCILSYVCTAVLFFNTLTRVTTFAAAVCVGIMIVIVGYAYLRIKSGKVRNDLI